MIEPDILDRLQSITSRTGLSKSEQIRQGIRWWLESREWPAKSERADAPATVAEGLAAQARSHSTRGSRRTRRRRS